VSIWSNPTGIQRLIYGIPLELFLNNDDNDDDNDDNDDNLTEKFI